MTTPPLGSREAAQDGGAAFACASVDGYQSGMSLRDWFAGQAAAHMMSDDGWGGVNNVARHAYLLADALLSARGETK